jgi:lysozyme family protein
MGDFLFQQAVTFTLGQEGGWADNPADPGGATMCGITLAVFRAWHHDPSAQPDDLRAIQTSEVEAIYRALYWNPVEGTRLPAGLGLSVFDGAVNLGVRRATMLLQGVLGVAQDGAVGPVTLEAANRVAASVLLGKLAQERETFYQRCASFELFGRGWLNRNTACLLAARQAAGLSAEKAPALPIPINGTPAQPAADDLNAGELIQIARLSP